MSTLDIRNETTEPVDTIIVADTDPNSYNLVRMSKEDEVVVVLDDSTYKYRLAITSEQHARDIIKGIEKAVDLGWFKDV